MGLLSIGLFGLQYAVGFYSFWWPRPRESIRRQILPFHVFLGVAVFVLGAATTCSGILEKVCILRGCTYCIYEKIYRYVYIDMYIYRYVEIDDI